MKVFMGIITLAATVLTFFELGALAQGTADPVLLIVAVIFIVAVLLGGLVFFRKMTRRQIFYSALVLSGLNLVMWLLACVGLTSVTNFYWMYLTAWDNVFFYLLPQSWVTILLRYLLSPHIFILFGKKRA